MEKEISMKALVLALGHGREMEPWSGPVPAPLLPVGDAPLLAQTVRWLKRFGIEVAMVALHHEAPAIEEALGDGSSFGMTLSWLDVLQPQGTARVAKQL